MTVAGLTGRRDTMRDAGAPAAELAQVERDIAAALERAPSPGAPSAPRRQGCAYDPLALSVSVIVTCHQPYLRYWHDAVRSALFQSIRPLEVIAMFDGCDPPANVPPGVECHRLDSGEPTALRNAGAVRATGQVLVFLDADDSLEMGYLEKGLPALADPRVGFVYPTLASFGESAITSPAPAWDYWAYRRQAGCLSGSALLRRQAYELSGGWRPMPRGQDYWLFSRMSERGWLGAPSQGVLYYRDHRSDGEQLTGRTAAERVALQPIVDAVTATIFTPLCGREEAWGGGIRDGLSRRRSTVAG